MKTLLALAALVLCLSGGPPALARPLAKPVAWVGIGTQTQRGMPPSRWRIHLAFDQAGNARIDYPGLRCGGVLRRIGHAGNVVRYREHIRYGRRQCIDGGIVTAWRRGNRLAWRWSGAGTDYPASRARATLVLSRHRGR